MAIRATLDCSASDAIAYTGSKRHPKFPDVPTVSETYPEVVGVGWHGIWAPAGVSNDIVQRLNAEVTRITQSPDVQKLLAEMGSAPLSASVDGMSSMIRAESKLWGDLLKTKHITVD